MQVRWDPHQDSLQSSCGYAMPVGRNNRPAQCTVIWRGGRAFAHWASLSKMRRALTLISRLVSVSGFSALYGFGMMNDANVIVRILAACFTWTAS